MKIFLFVFSVLIVVITDFARADRHGDIECVTDLKKDIYLNDGETTCVASPKFPAKYPNKVKQLVKVMHLLAGELMVHCPKSHIRFSKKCKDDSLTISGGGKDRRLCGRRSPSPFLSGEVSFEFRSNVFGRQKGYKCYIMALPSPPPPTLPPTPPPTTTTPQIQPDPCEAPFVYVLGRCLMFGLNKLNDSSWEAAEQECENLESSLLKLESVQFWQDLSEYMNARDLNSYYVGANDRDAAGQWVWLDGTAVNMDQTPSGFWFANNPTGATDYDCGYIERVKNYTLFDLSCTNQDYNIFPLCEAAVVNA